MNILDGNPIAGFPDMLTNARLTYLKKGVSAFISLQHVGKLYTDNFNNENNTVDAYTVFNGMIGYDLRSLVGVNGFTFQIHFRNIFDTIYISHGEGNRFFPAAGSKVG